MKNVIISLLVLVIPVASGRSRVCAAEPPLSSSSQKVLILKNEYTMEGDIERVGDRYRVRRKLGETWVPADRVLILLSSLPEAYAYLRGRINLEDPDERLRLARWCRANNLNQQALAELQVAAHLRPDHTETQRLLQTWKQIPPMADAPKTVAKTSASTAQDELPPVEVTTESLGLFVTRVQPILMNTCARCHATGHGGKFHLGQVYEDSIANRRTMERNLSAVLAQVNLDQPEASRLLTKSISDHARTGQAPLRDHQAAPYRTLEMWVKLTVANNPHLREGRPSSVPQAVSSVSPPFALERPAKNTEESEWGAESRVPSASSLPPPPSTSAKGADTPTNITDPYDPELFNRKMHPKTSKLSPAK